MTPKPDKVGRLRHVVTIEQQASATEDDYGGRTPVWTDYAASIWAQVRPVGGGEFFQGQKVTADTTHVVTVRYMAATTNAVTPTMRVNFGGRLLYVTRIIHVDEREEWLLLHCEERVS